MGDLSGFSHSIALSPQDDLAYRDSSANGVVLFLLFLFLVATAVLWNMQAYVVMLPILAFVLLAIRRVEYFVLFLFVLTMTISYPDYTVLPIPIFGSGFSVIELSVLFFAFASLAKKNSLERSRLFRTSIGKTMALYFGWLIFVLAWQLVILRNTSINEVRGYYPILAFFPMAILLKNDKQWFTVFKGLYVLAVVSGVVSLLIYFGFGGFNFWNNLTGSFRLDQFAIEGYMGPARVLLGGLLIAFALFLVSFAQFSQRRDRYLRYVPFMLFAALVMYISYTRGIVTSVLLGAFLIAVYALFTKRPFLHRRRVIALVLFMCAGLIVLAMLNIFYLDLASSRYLVLFQVQDVSAIPTADSMEWRAVENTFALSSILKDPVFGGGFGQSFFVSEGMASAATPHNAFVSLMYLFGVPALLFWAAASLAYVLVSWSVLRKWSQLSEAHRPWLLGFMVTFVALSVASLTAQFVTMKAVMLVALMFAYSHYLRLKMADDLQMSSREERIVGA
jgi:hypothetical protein